MAGLRRYALACAGRRTALVVTELAPAIFPGGAGVFSGHWYTSGGT